ncbi:MAG TPA: hypothetical protein VFD30_07945 [Terriglobia bacterium]|jgi:hypothetical membrane protein|nr:hypothetical protein [Terriglobia bacterium]
MPSQRDGQEWSKLARLLTGVFGHAQRLFHVVVGLAFLFLTLAGVAVSFSEWRYYTESPAGGLLRFYLVAGFTVFLFILCLYSFAKARSVR